MRGEASGDDRGKKHGGATGPLRARLLLVSILGLALGMGLALAPSVARALDRFQCGTYELSGRWDQAAGRDLLLLHAGTRNEERLELEGAPPAESLARQGRPVRVQVRVTRPFLGSGGTVRFEKIAGAPTVESLEREPVRLLVAGACEGK